MPYSVTDATWLTTEAERVKGLLLMPINGRERWQPQTLRVWLADRGLQYTLPEIQSILAALEAAGTLEQVP